MNSGSEITPQRARLETLHRENLSGTSVTTKPSRLSVVIGATDAPLSIGMSQAVDEKFRTLVTSEFTNASGRERRDSKHIRLHLNVRSSAPSNFDTLTTIEEADASWVSIDSNGAFLFTDYIHRIEDPLLNFPVLVRSTDELARDMQSIFKVAHRFYREASGYEGSLYVGISLTNLWGAAVRGIEPPPERQAQLATWHTELELSPGRTAGDAMFRALSSLLRDLQYADSEQPVRDALEQLGCELQSQEQEGRVAITREHAGDMQQGPTYATAQPTDLDRGRLLDLADNIRQDMDLLKRYEDALRYEDDPRRQAKYRRNIQELRKSAACYRREYRELQAETTSEPSVEMQSVASQLQEMDSKLNDLLEGHEAIQSQLTSLHYDVVAHFGSSERTIILAVVERLDHRQLSTIQGVLDALEMQSVPEEEMLHLLDAAQQVMAELQQQAVVLPGQQRLAEAIASPVLDAKHRLKLTVPIIPLLLAYEGEIELRGAVNLEAAWQRFVTWIRGE